MVFKGKKKEKSLNTIFLLGLHRKIKELISMHSRRRGCWCVWSYVEEETGVLGENHQHWTGDHYPATCRHQDLILGRSGGK